jgi:hypothetical protein
MSATVIAASSTEELISGFRAHKLSRAQVVAALVAAGATAGGAALLVNAVQSSPSTPAATAHHTAPALGAGIAHSNLAAMHVRHVAAQTGR